MEQARLSGPVCGIAVDGDGVLVAAEQGGGACLKLLRADGGEQQVLVREYEGRAFLGPHGVVIDGGGQLFFTDPGPPGETSIIDPRGSVFLVTGDGGGGPSRILRPLCLGRLGRPTGLALDPTESMLYVCEQSANRVLRLHQRPIGVWHTTVFATFSGRLGPVAIACDATRGGILYVARPELPEVSDHGIISVLSPDGTVLRELEVPGADITSLALAPPPPPQLQQQHQQGEEGEPAAPSAYLVYACAATAAVYKVLL